MRGEERARFQEAPSLHQLPLLIEQIVAQAEEQVIGHDGDDDFEDKNDDDSVNGHDQVDDEEGGCHLALSSTG